MKNFSKYSDKDLLSLFLDNDESAFTELYDRHNPKVLNKIVKVVKSYDVAHDLMQETFIKVFNTIREGNYNEEGKFMPWLLRIAHNKAIDWYRKRQRYPLVSSEDVPNAFNTALDRKEITTEDIQIKQDVINKLMRLIENLSESQKQVVKMRSFQGLSFQEIAEETGVSINTALGRMRYALINLRKEMDDSDALALNIAA